MGSDETAVATYLDGLEHRRRDDVVRLWRALRDGVPRVEASVKWNAPNFSHAGEDRVTFRLRPRDRFQLVFHRGAKVRADAATFRFDDPCGSLEWPSRDRAVLAVPDPMTAEDVTRIVELANRWIRAGESGAPG